jgi:2TM domain
LSRVERGGVSAFRRHALVFVLANALLTGVNVYMGAPWWAFWPLVVWGLALMVHFFFHRAATADEAWVEERALDLRSKSYDLSHIDDIRAHPAPSITDPAADKPRPAKH